MRHLMPQKSSEPLDNSGKPPVPLRLAISEEKTCTILAIY